MEKLLLHVNSGDPDTQEMAIRNINNVRKVLGEGNVAFELVAYGPGARMLFLESPLRDQIDALVAQGIAFTVCGFTLDKIQRETGDTPALIDGVEIVPSGVVRIMELQGEGYKYLKP